MEDRGENTTQRQCWGAEHSFLDRGPNFQNVRALAVDRSLPWRPPKIKHIFLSPASIYKG